MHADIQNVFTPAAAIEDATRFAGRQEQLDGVSMALQSEGTQIVIYGNRGVGKSSLARQLAALARGDMSVFDRLTMKPHQVPDYLVISLECDDSVNDIRALILRLLTEDTALAPWIPFPSGEEVHRRRGGRRFECKDI
ncbi:ATP-binding protein [Inquilinus limosus]|uniref:ATP-binding protein n=1 Tax=Inquilinus limosus TaxID=171674 RepID=UPI003F1602A0